MKKMKNKDLFIIANKIYSIGFRNSHLYGDWQYIEELAFELKMILKKELIENIYTNYQHYSNEPHISKINFEVATPETLIELESGFEKINEIANEIDKSLKIKNTKHQRKMLLTRTIFEDFIDNLLTSNIDSLTELLANMRLLNKILTKELLTQLNKSIENHNATFLDNKKNVIIDMFTFINN